MPRSSPAKKLSLLPLAAVIFLTVSGGPYGLEPLIYYVGGKGALLLLIATPLLWDIPVILTVLELNSMMPVTGGYYQWVKTALGLPWAFCEGWWTWLYTFVDLAIYPQLFITYAMLFFPGIAAYKVPICLCVVWGCAALNIFGIVPVGRAAIAIAGLVLAPFILLFVFSFAHHPVAHSVSAYSPGFSFIGMALFTVMWNFIGWDNVTTYAREVQRPVRSYIKAMTIALIIVVLLYLVTTITAQRSGISPGIIKDAGYPALGDAIGMHWLAICIAAGGMLSSLGLFSAVLLSVSRVPQVMADDRLLPAWLHKLHPRYKTPYISIILCAVVVSCMTFWSFGELLVIDITIYFAGLVLEFVSLIVLRKKEPYATRPFRIPLNTAGLYVLILLPVAVYFTALIHVMIKGGGLTTPILFSLALLGSAGIAWPIVSRIRTKNMQKSQCPPDIKN